MTLDPDEQVAPTVATPGNGDITPPSEHDGGLGREVMAASLKAKLFGRDGGFPRCGRFEVRRQVGMGGMGVVYEGWDPDLERKVALKVLHESASESGDQRKRLVREAQTLAKLRHPNVVQVYEVGAEGGRLFIAMEYVEGETLRAWLRKADRGWKEVLEKYVEAGRGLAAAHTEGLVHRDFKPDNVMVTTSGEVRVLDFGLAREEFDPEALSRAGNLRPDELTQTGALLGTPLYMAPEQFAGKPADARTDQFSFCVALWEGLYGQRPFRGKTIDELSARVTGGTMELPRKGNVPGRVRKAMLRGLSTHAGARWAGMPQLLSALTPRASANRAVAAFLGVGIVSALGTMAMVRQESLPPCADERAHVEAVWGDAQRNQVSAAIRNSGFMFANSAATTVTTALDAYATELVDRSIAICESLRSPDASANTTLRATCLDRRRIELAGLVEVLAGANEQLAGSAAWAVHALTPLDDCDDERLVRAEVALPSGAADTPAARELWLRLARQEALVSASVRDEPRARQLVADARTAGQPFVEAEALFLLGTLLHATSRGEEAAAVLSECLQLAESIGHDRIAARAAASRVFAELGDPSPNPDHVRRAQTLVERTADPEATFRLRYALARREYQSGNFDRATREYEAIIAYVDEHLGPLHRYSDYVRQQLAMDARRRSDADAALRWVEADLEVRKQLYGTDALTLDPMAGLGRSASSAWVLAERGRTDEALAMLPDPDSLPDEVSPTAELISLMANKYPAALRERAHDLVLGTVDRLLADKRHRGDDAAWMALEAAHALARAGKVDEGLAVLGRAETELGRGSSFPATPRVMFQLVGAQVAILIDAGRLEPARTHLDRLRELARASPEVKDEWMVTLADTLLALASGQPVAALESARKIENDCGDNAHCWRAVGLARAANEIPAVTYLEEAVRLYRQGGDQRDPGRADAELALARMLHDDPSRAIELARSAATLYADLGRKDDANAARDIIASLGGGE